MGTGFVADEVGREGAFGPHAREVPPDHVIVPVVVGVGLDFPFPATVLVDRLPMMRVLCARRGLRSGRLRTERLLHWRQLVRRPADRRSRQARPPRPCPLLRLLRLLLRREDLFGRDRLDLLSSHRGGGGHRALRIERWGKSRVVMRLDRVPSSDRQAVRSNGDPSSSCRLTSCGRSRGRGTAEVVMRMVEIGFLIDVASRVFVDHPGRVPGPLPIVVVEVLLGVRLATFPRPPSLSIRMMMMAILVLRREVVLFLLFVTLVFGESGRVETLLLLLSEQLLTLLRTHGPVRLARVVGTVLGRCDGSGPLVVVRMVAHLLLLIFFLDRFFRAGDGFGVVERGLNRCGRGRGRGSDRWRGSGSGWEGRPRCGSGRKGDRCLRRWGDEEARRERGVPLAGPLCPRRGLTAQEGSLGRSTRC